MSVDKIFEALSSAPRRRILAYLSKTDMTAGEIADRFAEIMSQPAISKHLTVLENAGLVWREKRGQNVHYGLKEDALTRHAGAFPGRGVPALASLPQGERGSRPNARAAPRRRAEHANARTHRQDDCRLSCGVTGSRVRRGRSVWHARDAAHPRHRRRDCSGIVRGLAGRRRHLYAESGSYRTLRFYAGAGALTGAVAWLGWSLLLVSLSPTGWRFADRARSWLQWQLPSRFLPPAASSAA